MGMRKPPKLAVTHDVASCEPQDDQSDEEMTETAVATAMATAPGLVGFRVWVGRRGRRDLRCSLVAGWELIQRHTIHLEVHLVVGIGREEKAFNLGRLSRRHWDKRVWVKRVESGEYKLLVS
jgi:hypothetical protein